jgi:Zn-dependent metalloprotease
VRTREDNGGVHVNSGIPNHAFYLAAVGIDLNKPQTLNSALNQDDGKTLTLGIRYVASRSLLSEVASLQATNPGSQDVTAGNVSVFLPFLLKLN